MFDKIWRSSPYTRRTIIVTTVLHRELHPNHRIESGTGANSSKNVSLERAVRAIICHSFGCLAGGGITDKICWIC